jgi:hypothetical protein
LFYPVLYPRWPYRKIIIVNQRVSGITISIGPWAPLMVAVAVFTVALLGLTNRDPAEVR